MKRSLYRCLILLHPAPFRERFAEEMLWIFDQTEGEGMFQLFIDSIVSVVRQWMLRSGIWKMAAGAAISSMLLFGWWQSQESSLREALRRGNPGQVAEARHQFLRDQGTPFDGVFGGVVQAAASPATSEWPIRPIEISPRIAEVRQELKSGESRVIDRFWQDVVRTGTPLIEPAKGSPGEVIVTFVWRGDTSTKDVGVLAPLVNSPGLPNQQLVQLVDTNLWYGSWQVRDDLRFTYRFAPNVKPGENPQQFATADPLNPHKMEVSFEGNRIPATQLSIASMPRAPEERWIAKQAAVPTGKIGEYTLKSAVLGKDRKIWVYTPANYNDKEPEAYRLLVLFDGFSYQNWIPAPTILDNLIHSGKVPATVAVLIDNPPESRMSELEYNLTFVAFFEKELLPWVHDHWNVTRDPQKTIVGGYSAGGAAAAFVAMQRPALIGNVLSQSGSFWDGNKDLKWEWLATQYETSPKLPLRFFIEAGVLEDVAKEGPTLLAANRRFVKILKSKGYSTTYEEVGGTHEPVHWRNTFGDGLVSLTK